MAHTYSVIFVHSVFSTKERLPLIPEPEKLWSILRGVASHARINVLAVGGTANHVHMLLAVPSTRSVADVMRELKANSSQRMRQKWPKFSWQDGYGAMSVSPTAIKAVTQYIEHLREHHAHRPFEEEYIAMLQRAGVQYDSEYVLDWVAATRLRICSRHVFPGFAPRAQSEAAASRLIRGEPWTIVPPSCFDSKHDVIIERA
jgi:putative transposase